MRIYQIDTANWNSATMDMWNQLNAKMLILFVKVFTNELGMTNISANFIAFNLQR